MAASKHNKMKALRWEGKPFSVSIRDVEIPKITDSLDVIVRLTSAAICGTDLHTYHGRIPTTKPLTLGHESMGIVHEIGNDITTLKKGDRVLVTSAIDQGTDNGVEVTRGSYGIGNYVESDKILILNGGQAQYMRVPFANVNLLKLPPGDELELDYLVLADIWPTAWFALECAGQVLGDTVVVFGAGPVGLLCAYSALLRGATRVYSVDHVPKRLAKAKSIGAIPINFKDGDPVAQILKFEPNGVDRSCDCVGFECIDASGKNVENIVITQAIEVTRPYGGIGLIGVYILNDLRPSRPDGGIGNIVFPAGVFWAKGLSLRGGGVLIHQFQPLLKSLIDSGKARPGFVFDKEYRIEEGQKAFREFSEQKIVKAVFRFDGERNGRGRESRSRSPKRSRSSSGSESRSRSPKRRYRKSRGHGSSPF